MDVRRWATRLSCAAMVMASASAVQAQESEDRPPWRYRIAIGPQIAPSFPGSDGVSLRPYVEVDRARGDTPFEYEAPDESFGIPFLRSGKLDIGPAIAFEGKRGIDEAGARLPEIGFTVELGGFVQYYLTDAVRLRAEVRQGIGGHKALISEISADYVARKGDDWLFSIGPRLTIGDDRYHRRFFGVDAAASTTSGLPVYAAKGGLQAVGATAGYLRQLGRKWGLMTYARYDRLVGDAADSPITRRLGSRNQFTGGVALSYTFGGGRR